MSSSRPRALAFTLYYFELELTSTSAESRDGDDWQTLLHHGAEADDNNSVAALEASPVEDTAEVLRRRQLKMGGVIKYIGAQFPAHLQSPPAGGGDMHGVLELIVDDGESPQIPPANADESSGMQQELDKLLLEASNNPQIPSAEEEPESHTTS